MQLSRFQRIVLWAFERFYHEGAWTYDSVAWLVSRGYWSRWIAAVLPDVAGAPLLELGCGTGYLQRGRRGAPDARLPGAPGAAALTVGLDESPQMLRLARRKAGIRPGRGPGCNALLRARAQSLPFADRSWPAVVATFPAPYLFDPRTLGEIRRVLRPGGRLLIVDGGVIPSGPYARLVGQIYRLVLGQPADAGPQQGIDGRIERLEQAGFTVGAEWRDVGASQVQILTAQGASGEA